MIPEVLPTDSYAVAPETWLLPTLAAHPSGGYFGAHSLVIRGAEPVVVDTGCFLVREHWLRELEQVVDLPDVRWIFLSHDDHDHLGNLDAVLDACPGATLVASYDIVGRLIGDVELPLERMRWLNEGESLTLPDRVLTAVRPPMFDSPTTRALFDGSTGVMWAVDSFGAAVPGAVFEKADVPAEMYDPTFDLLNLGNTPWLSWADPHKFAAHARESAALAPSAIVSAHGPVLRGAEIADAYRRTLDLVGRDLPVAPGQDVLEMLLPGLLAGAA